MLHILVSTSYRKIKAVGTLLNEQASYIDCHWVTMFRNIPNPISVGLLR